MVVHRWTWKVKPGCKKEFIELTKDALEEQGVTPRICSFIFGPYDTVLVEIEFETMQDRQAYFDSIDWSKPKISEWAKKHNGLIESGTVNELLRVH